MENKKCQFKAEIAEMLDLVVNSLYSKKEIFLRELISNASDAIDRAKFLSLTDKNLVSDNPEWKIEIGIISHIGDGNIHPIPLKPAEMPPERWAQHAEDFFAVLIREAIA